MKNHDSFLDETLWSEETHQELLVGPQEAVLGGDGTPRGGKLTNIMNQRADKEGAREKVPQDLIGTEEIAYMLGASLTRLTSRRLTTLWTRSTLRDVSRSWLYMKNASCV